MSRVCACGADQSETSTEVNPPMTEPGSQLEARGDVSLQKGENKPKKRKKHNYKSHETDRELRSRQGKTGYYA